MFQVNSYIPETCSSPVFPTLANDTAISLVYALTRTSVIISNPFLQDALKVIFPSKIYVIHK